MMALRAFWAVGRSFTAKRLAIAALYVVAVIAFYYVFRDNPQVADVGRFIGLLVAVMIFGSWVVIMSRSAIAYVESLEADSEGDTDLRAHIWEITLSYLIYVAATTYDIIENVGGRLQADDLTLMLIAGPLGLHALWIFLRPDRRKRIKLDERSTTVSN